MDIIDVAIARKFAGGSGGGSGDAKPEQSKTIEITQNGDYKITPDSGKVLSSATAKVNVPERYDEGFAEGKEQGLSQGYASGFGAGVNSVKLQEKTATENGDVLPDEGFSGMSKVTVNVPTSGSGEIGKPYIDTSQMTDFSYFCNNGARVDTIDNLDTSNSTDFSYMFCDSKTLESVSSLDTSNGTNFQAMFSGCSALKSVSQLNTSNGTNFQAMFHSCSALKSISQLNTSNGKNFVQTFLNCHLLDNLSLTTAKSDCYSSTFQNCTALTNLTIGEGWAVSIYLTYSNNLTQESLHGMIENLADLTGATAKTFSIGATNLAKIDEDHIAMLNAKNWNYS